MAKISKLQTMTWGRIFTGTRQGWALTGNPRLPFIWTSSWSGNHGTHDRDGKTEYRGHAWRSENDIDISYPAAVMDDFGTLVPIPLPEINTSLEFSLWAIGMAKQPFTP